MLKENKVALMSFLLVLANAFFCFDVRAEVVDRIIAYVNDDIITLSELNEETQAFVSARSQNPFLREHDESLESIRQNVLNTLINERLAAQEIARLGISVGETEVDEMIAAIKKENQLTDEALEAQLRKEGKTILDFRQSIRQNLERSKLINRQVRSKTVVTDDLVEAYYKSNSQEFQGKERWRLRDIFLPYPSGANAEDQARLQRLAKQILDRLLQGTDFATMAKGYSQGPGAEEGGDLGFFSEGELDPALEKAVKKLRTGEVSPIITTERGLHIVKITDVDQKPAKPLEEVRETIRRKLYQREVNFKYREWLSGLRERSYVKVAY